MNIYTKNLNRIEFVITLACTGHCKHCSQGVHTSCSEHIDSDTAAQVVYDICKKFRLDSVMTFGGEPLLYPESVYSIHNAAKEMNIPARQLITNGFFSKNTAKIEDTAVRLVQSGVNDIALSVDAFHQETIGLEPVKTFARAVKSTGVTIHTHPAWLVSREDKNPYNLKTAELLKEFEQIGISSSEGNIIFPSGNAVKYFENFFDSDKEYISPYTENPEDVHTISISPNGNTTLGENVYNTNIADIIRNYTPNKMNSR